MTATGATTRTPRRTREQTRALAERLLPAFRKGVLATVQMWDASIAIEQVLGREMSCSDLFDDLACVCGSEESVNAVVTVDDVIHTLETLALPH